MGITVGELLSFDFFRDFQVIAGKKGLDREIQGVTISDAPDGYRWAVGKELAMTSGYLMSNSPGYLENLENTFSTEQAALIIKRGRYLEKIPDQLIRLHDKHNIPLITMPYSIPWMEVNNQVNVAVMNHAIQAFAINNNCRYNSRNQNYKDQKIKSLLQIVEREMEFPAMLYDVFEQKFYYSSANFQKTSEKYGLRGEDYWGPSGPHTCHTLCDCIKMIRYRLCKGEAENDPRISWVTIPILIGNVPQAYFCVMESRKFLDFYDEYSMRIAFLMLQGLYEQIAVARDASNLGFENLIHLMMEYKEEDYTKIVYQAKQLNISVEQKYRLIVFQHDHVAYDIRSRRSEVIEIFEQCRIGRYGRLAFLSKTEGMILWDAKSPEEMGENHLHKLIEEFKDKLKWKFDGINWRFSYINDLKELFLLKTLVEKCRKIIRIGKIVFPEQEILNYDQLGILTWLDIPEDEMKILMEELQKLLKVEKNKELLYTLKVYLENNMNYSLTAEKLFVNINTIRRRIEKVNDLIRIDWDNYFERTKIGLLLQFLQ